MSNLNENFLANIISEPLISKVISPDFMLKELEEQKSIYNSISAFRNFNVSFENMLEMSRDFYHTSDNFIISSLSENIKALIDLQSKTDGAWHLADPRYLMTLKYDLAQKIYDLSKSNKERGFATPWINSLIIILLKKWRDYFSSTSNEQTLLKQVKQAIEDGCSWLSNQIVSDQYVNTIRGWTFLKPLTNTVSTFETSMSLIALNYHFSGFGFSNKNKQQFIGKQHIKSLLNKNLKIKDGSWKTDTTSGVDTGATSYALLCLLKYCEICSDRKTEELHKPILDGIEWLGKNQRDDGGWGIESRDNSKSSYVEKTCYSIMAISKYQKYFGDDYSGNIELGIKFLKNSLSKYHDFPEKYAWSNDYSNDCINKPSLKHSSLALSTMLRTGVASYNFELKKSLMGLIRVYEDIKYTQETTWEDRVYYYCMLSDYLRVLE